jgi:Serine incorporator (Serinc)
MLLTNWGNPTVWDNKDGQTIPYYSANDQSFWVKLSVQWLSTALYLFSMIAPVIFPDREF